MVLKSKNYYLLRVFNYIILIALLVLLNREGKVNIYLELILSLVYILNSQLRVYTFEKSNNNRKLIFLLSILLECTITVFLFKLLGVHLFVLLYIVILDIILYFKNNLALIMIGALGISSILLEISYSSDNVLDGILFNGISFMIFTLLGIYLKEEESKKRKAQNHYDRLRISEEELEKANKELEMYSNTVEELTLLRERTRVSRELHDSVGHYLSTLCIQLKAIKTLISNKPEMAEKMIESNIKYTEDTLENVRRTVRELKPVEFEAYEGIFTIEEMIKNFSKLTGINVKLILSKEKWKLTSEQSHNLYRIIQESLSNSLRHGKAKNVSISIQFLKGKLYTQIKDDGKGCSDLNPSFGLKGIKERISSMKGTIEFYTELEKGFEVTITLPKYRETTK